MGQFTTTLNKHRSTILARKVREATNYQKLHTGLYLNWRDLFYLEDFFGGIGIMLLRLELNIFWNNNSKSRKEEI